MLVASGLFVSTYMGVGLGKGAVSTLLTIGLTMIPAAALVEHALARSVVQALLIGIAMAIASQWVVYPFFPEDKVAARPKKASSIDCEPVPRGSHCARRSSCCRPCSWPSPTPRCTWRSTLKAVLLGQQGSAVRCARGGHRAARSTFLAGVFANRAVGRAAGVAEPVDVLFSGCCCSACTWARRCTASPPPVFPHRSGSMWA
jgi:hypothetical protein